jgi:hypothetical protein
MTDGGGHERMLSGDVIWCNTCGSYADLRADGLTEPCTGNHIGPWKGGGKRGQLVDLRRCIHPRNRSTLPPPIAEATMAIDAAIVASPCQQQAAKQTQARYSAKDKATARQNATDPKAALTEEKRQWIENKRKEAIQRQAEQQLQQQKQQQRQRRIELEPEQPNSTQVAAAFLARMRAKFAAIAAKRAAGEDFESQRSPARHRDSPPGSTVDERPHNEAAQGDGDQDTIPCERCGEPHTWQTVCLGCDLIACNDCTSYHKCPSCDCMMCKACTGPHEDRCRES